MAEENEQSGGQRIWRRFALAMLLLMNLCWAATLYCMVPATWFLWEPITVVGSDRIVELEGDATYEGTVFYNEDRSKVSVILADGETKEFVDDPAKIRVVRQAIPIRPALLLAAAFFLVASWLMIVRLKGKLDFHKPGQGTPVRISTYVVVLAIAVYGAYTLHSRGPGLESYWRTSLASWTVLGIELAVRPILFPSVGVALLMMLITHLVANRSRMADFLIETEGELRKVSWPSRKEFVGSSIVVLIVTVTMALFLAAVDYVLSQVMGYIGGI